MLRVPSLATTVALCACQAFLSVLSADERAPPQRGKRPAQKNSAGASAKKMDELLQTELLAPWSAGNVPLALKNLRAQIGRGKQLSELNEALERAKLPGAAALLLDLHVRMLRAGSRETLNEASVKERVLLIQETER